MIYLEIKFLLKFTLNILIIISLKKVAFVLSFFVK
nr:MAG TPA: hypothetical protein [Caudoviricetes sp.]